MRVNIEEIAGIMARLNDINMQQLEDVELFEGGKKIDVDNKLIEDFRFTGLSNKDFISSGFYLHGWKEVEG